MIKLDHDTTNEIYHCRINLDLYIYIYIYMQINGEV